MRRTQKMNWLNWLIYEFIRSILDNPNKVRIPIGPNPDDPTYWRWFVWKRNRFFNCYLHNFRRDDEEDFHDHRMVNISFLLEGSYFDEHFVDGLGRRTMPRVGQPLPRTGRTLVREHRLMLRLPSWPHRVVLRRDSDGNPIPCWSLFIAFLHWRKWGFWCAGKDRRSAFWRPYEEYVADINPENSGYGRPGRGCGE